MPVFMNWSVLRWTMASSRFEGEALRTARLHDTAVSLRADGGIEKSVNAAIAKGVVVSGSGCREALKALDMDGCYRMIGDAAKRFRAS